MFAFRLPVTLRNQYQNDGETKPSCTEIKQYTAKQWSGQSRNFIRRKKNKHYELNEGENTKAVPSEKLRGSNV